MSDDVKAIPKRALELENRAIWPNNEPTLFAAYQVLRDQWLLGHRDRESALHLAFLAWFMTVDFDTGYLEVETDESDIELATLFGEAHDWLDPIRSEDPEVVYVFHVICEVGTLFEDSDGRLWEEARREQYRKRYRRMLVAGIDPDRFANRGYFGDYFAGHARATGEGTRGDR